jgi:SPP1 family predicted phage head-tail adaptor
MTILAPTSQQDSYNQDIQVWTSIATVWASIKTLTGKQIALAQADTITSTATHEIHIRWRGDVTTLNKIQFGTVPFLSLTTEQFQPLTTDQFLLLASSGTIPRTFTINAVNDVDGMLDELVLTVTEVQS